MDRRLAPPGATHLKSTLERLTTAQPGRSYPIFQTKQKALMFAAALGKHLGRREPVKQRDSASAIRFDIFQNHMDDGLVYALAVAEDGDLKVLDDARAEEVAVLFEEFAHGGLIEIHQRCFESGGDPLDILLQLTLDARESESEAELEGLDPAVFRNFL